jgi:hypothetical protein
VTIATVSANSLANVERRSVGNVSGTRSIAGLVVGTHERAVEETELVAGSLLATVAPSIGGTLVSILAEVGHSSGLECAGGEVASPRRVDIAGALAAKAERRGIELGDVVRSIRLTIVGDLPVVVDIAILESSVVDVFGLVEGTVEIRTH